MSKLKNTETYQVVVIGGGMAGVCAAIAAARQGVNTVLVQDRPVLGGNSSAEIGVPFGGADHKGRNRHARETGIMDELIIENAAFPNPSNPENSQGFSGNIWSLILWSVVRKEDKLTLYLNTTGKEPQVQDNKIKSIMAEQHTTGREWKIKGDVFIDCSGDGRIAFESGAEYMRGREGKQKYGESMAPEKPDEHTMGNSVYMRARDVGYPVPFVPPEWAHKFPTDDDFPGGIDHCPHNVRLLTGHPGGYWWIEFGGVFDTIEDSEYIRDELWRYAVGVWDHIKNNGDHGAENYVLDEINIVPGKRESRRFKGDYILKERDLTELREFDDAVAYGGWNIDLHYPKGIKGSKYWHGKDLKGKYSIPLRSLYSVNINNLFFAGRNLSASHVALGSPRVMATCAVMGQAVGTAAYFCIEKNLTPREVGKKYIKELQQDLIKQDAYIPGVKNEDKNDFALKATISASSQSQLEFPEPEEYKEVNTKIIQSFVGPVTGLERVKLPLRNTGEKMIEVKLYLCKNSQLDLFSEAKILSTQKKILPQGDHWVEFDFSSVKQELKGKIYQIALEPQQNLFWGYSSKEPLSTQAGKADKKDFIYRERGTYCLRVEPDIFCYSPEQVISGVNRPEKDSNIWISKKGFPQKIELTWTQPVSFNNIQIIFDNNLDKSLRRYSDNRVAPELVKDYDIFAKMKNNWVKIVSVRDNYHRRCCHNFSDIKTDTLKLELLSANGIEEARIFEIRIYNK